MLAGRLYLSTRYINKKEDEMNNIYVVVLLILTGVALISMALWEAFGAIKHKNNKEEFKTVVTKARADSAKTLWFVFMCWELLTFFIKGEPTFTLNNIHTMVLIMFGLQCTVELFAGIYHESKIARA